MCELKCITVKVHCQKGRNITLVEKKERGTDLSREYMAQETDGVHGIVTLSEIAGGKRGDLSLKIKNESCRENWNLEMEKPIALEWELDEKPEKITAMYLFNDWWTRPAFINGFEEIPERTQIAFLKYKDHYNCLLPMVGQAFKTYLAAGKEKTVVMEMTACMGGMSSVDEPVFLITEDKTLYGAIEKAFTWVAEEKGIRRKDQKRLPEMFQYLGWCSWDAFYTEITEEKVREKAKELEKKQIPVRWMLMDDGWLAVENELLYDFAPEKKKFPFGFRKMIDDIKGNGKIQWFGVWHALGGYWGGILPNSRLETAEKEHLYYASNGKILPSPRADEGFGFYRNWYEYLQREGIDFVKVDGQSAVKNYFENSIPVSQAARGIHRALESGAACLDGAVINCMGMAMENMIGRQGSAVSRNSDDFVPGRENGFAEHLLQNAYNALYQDELYYCDWDMFWTDHEDGIKHSLLRAVSGGPVYFSDRIGETNPKILEPLMYKDGKLLMMDRAAKPTADCLFCDPQKEGVLKLTNVAAYGQEKGGGIAAYNLTGRRQKYSFSPADVWELEADGQYWIYDYFEKKATLCGRQEKVTAELDKDGYAWYQILPAHGAGVFLGRTDKYVGFMAVEEIQADEERMIGIIKEQGTIGFLSVREPEKVLCNGQDVTGAVRGKNMVYTVALEQNYRKSVIEVIWKDSCSKNS